jgi:HSP20 family protein
VTTLHHRDKGEGGATSPLGRIDRLLEEWLRSLPMPRPARTGWNAGGEEMIGVDEFRDGDIHVIRAEIPGIDPDRDVDLTVVDGTLRIQAERRAEEESEEKGYTRRELRYGSFVRVLPLPDGAAAADVSATYEDGILEIRVPVPPSPPREPTRIPVVKK